MPIEQVSLWRYRSWLLIDCCLIVKNPTAPSWYLLLLSSEVRVVAVPKQLLVFCESPSGNMEVAQCIIWVEGRGVGGVEW